jgi:hypothetical protein
MIRGLDATHELGPAPRMDEEDVQETPMFIEFLATKKPQRREVSSVRAIRVNSWILLMPGKYGPLNHTKTH